MAQATWAQIAFWDVLRWLPQPDALNQTLWTSAPPATTVDRMVESLRALVERHEALRTLFAMRDGALTQQVVDAGTLTAQLFEIEGTDVEAYAVAVAQHVRRGAFASDVDLPIRLAAVTQAGQVSAVVLVVNHLAADGWSLAIVKEDLRRLLHGETLPERADQPLDRAAYEASEAGQRREKRTLDFWRRTMSTVSPTMLVATDTAAGAPRDWARIESTALAGAARRLAPATGGNPVTVVLAGIALLLATRVQESEATLRVIVSTRFRPQEREFVGAFNQNGLFHIGLGAMTVREYLQQSSIAALAAYRNCEGHQERIEQLCADIAADRGFVPRGYCFFNDVRFTAPKRGEDNVPDDLRAALSETRLLQLEDRGSQRGAKFFVFLGELSGICTLTLALDPAFAQAGTALGFLGDLEQLLVTAAERPDDPITPLTRLIVTHDGGVRP
ncbi:condensation domain-containing protein [Micromonospora sp. NPDC050417]|uniref:condensation domain-containing protein n=1 Tax=Micromonospora sp. NPDC050417 TaxID=3364280 RepID=UPI00379DB5D5